MNNRAAAAVALARPDPPFSDSFVAHKHTLITNTTIKMARGDSRPFADSEFSPLSLSPPITYKEPRSLLDVYITTFEQSMITTPHLSLLASFQSLEARIRLRNCLTLVSSFRPG